MVRGRTSTAVILNALDETPDLARDARLEDERRALAAVASDVTELDLRAFVGAPDALRDALDGVGLVWAVGGNALALRAAMMRSGLDMLLAARTAEDSLVYGGYSAGAVVAGPTLCDADVSPGPFAGAQPVWGGIGLVDFTVVPHYRAGAAEDEAFEQIVSALQRAGLAHRALRNGQALVVDGGTVTLIGA